MTTFGGQTAEIERLPCRFRGWPVAPGWSDDDGIALYRTDCGMKVVIHSAAGARRLRELVAHGNRFIEPRGAIAG